MALRLAKVPCWTTNAFWPGSKLFLAGYGPLSVQKTGAFISYISQLSVQARERAELYWSTQFVWITACYCPDVSCQLFQWILFSGRFIRGTSFFKSLCSRPLLSNKISPVFFLGGREGLYTGYPLFRHLNCSKVAFLKEWFLRRISFFIDLSLNKHFQLFVFPWHRASAYIGLGSEKK